MRQKCAASQYEYFVKTSPPGRRMRAETAQLIAALFFNCAFSSAD